MNDSVIVEALSLFGIGFITGLSGAIIPGPLFAFAISDALKKGFISGPLTALGHVIAEMPVIIAFMLGIGTLLMGFQRITYAVGGVVFIIMSLLIMRASLHHDASAVLLNAHRTSCSKPKSSRASLLASQQYASKQNTSAQRNTSRTTMRSIIGGLIFTAFNPSFIPWWMTAGFPVLLIGLSSPLAHVGVIIVVIGHLTSDISWYSLVSMLIAMGRRHIIGRWYKTLMLIVASFLAALGMIFVLNAYFA